MPTYDYLCNDCGEFDAIRSISRRDEPADCPDCGQSAPRVMAYAPSLSYLGMAQRLAHATNERASNVPRSSRDQDSKGSYGRLKHPSGCGCCNTSKRGATVRTPDGAKGFPSKRPWMISH